MTEPTGTHGVSTTLPDDLWQLFVDEAHEEDRNWSAHLRRIVKEHFARKAAEERKRNMVDDLRGTITASPAPNSPWVRS
jgi:hypothetical protein